MNRIYALVFIAISFISINCYSQPNIIFDTDFGGDVDDLGALAMFHHFIDRNECDLLAIMLWRTEINTVSAVDAVNRFYNNPDIPIGTRKGETYYTDWNYNKVLTDNFPFRLTYDDVPDATYLYRKILSQSQDKSIIIVTVGPLANITYLIESKPDTLSNLNGKDLITKKVKEFVIMGGEFPEGKKEWNFDGEMVGITKFVIENIEVPIVFSGSELGSTIKTGSEFNTIDKKTPLYIGFMHFSQYAPWVKMYFDGGIFNNSSFDQTAVLYAVRNGVGLYWDKSKNGICLPDDVGGNKWIEKEGANHSYLKLKMKPEDLANIINSCMLGDF